MNPEPICPACGKGMHRDTVCGDRVWKCDMADCRHTIPRLSTNVILHSSYADITVRREDGMPVTIDYDACGGRDEWNDLERFDPAELPDAPEGDVLDVGFWTKDGKHFERARDPQYDVAKVPVNVGPIFAGERFTAQELPPGKVPVEKFFAPPERLTVETLYDDFHDGDIDRDDG